MDAGAVCWRCEGTGQCVTRTEPYTFTYQGREIATKSYTYVAPCGVCDRGRRLAEARAAKGIHGDRQEPA